MVKLSQEIKQNIINEFKNNIDIKEIIKKYNNISRASIYRIKKLIENENLDNNNNETENETNNENISNNETNNENIENNETNNEDTNIEDTNNEDINEISNNFDIEQFKRELNNEPEPEEEEEQEEEQEINNKNNNISVISNNVSQISKKSIKSVKSVKSVVNFNKKKEIINNHINDKNSIMDTIKNCNVAENIDELKEIRHHIIIIKQYINTFPNDLKQIYGNNKYIFEKKLFTLNLNQLKIILEDIRISINLKTNKNSFMNLSQIALKGIETISNYSGYDVSGLEQELMNDESFIMDLQIIAAETDLSKYLNPKTSAFIKVIRKMHMINKQNQMKQTINNLNNNPNILNKINELKINK